MNLTTATARGSNTVTIVIYDVVEESGSLAEHHGQKVYDRIAAAFEEGKSVILSFRNLAKLTWSVVFSAIAQLYEHFPEEQIEASLSFVDIDERDRALIDKVVGVKKDYLKDPERPPEPLSAEELEQMKRDNPDNPWIQMAGKYKDDPQFDEMLAYIEEDRRQLDAEMEAYYRQLDAEDEAK